MEFAESLQGSSASSVISQPLPAGSADSDRAPPESSNFDDSLAALPSLRGFLLREAESRAKFERDISRLVAYSLTRPPLPHDDVLRRELMRH